VREKSHLESKKFVAWLISSVLWKIILIVALVVWKDALTQVGWGAWSFLMSVVVTAGFLDIGYILSVAALDKYVRVAEIAAEEIRHKMGGKADPPADPPTDPGVTP
jgi:hypothetical protein